MELRSTINYKMPRVFVWLTILMLVSSLNGYAQPPVKSYLIKDGKMHIELSKNLPASSLDSFIRKFNLHDLGLHELLKASKDDSLKVAGWITNRLQNTYILTKPFLALEKLVHAGDRISVADRRSTMAGFPPTSANTRYGYNRFKNKKPFNITDSLVTFYLRNNLKAQKVLLAGSFTSWQDGAVPMKKTDSGWIATMKLNAGKYWYKFIVDEKWQVDPDNLSRENDSEGNMNSVYFKTNYTFSTTAFPSAKRVYLAGSFNDWRTRELLLENAGAAFVLPIYLAEETHTYKYIADGNWYTDETNKNRLPDEFGGYNSVISLGKEYLFKLDGFTNAKQVILSGSFNNWRIDELSMRKTATGWELPYSLRSGNYEYKYIVDGKWISDPSVSQQLNNDGQPGNTFLIIDPNYTFRLKGFTDAKQVFIAGDFNEWNPTSLKMLKEGDDWIFKMHLGVGKHRYKFIVDGQWIQDPNNKLWENNEYNSRNSIIWVE